MGRSVNKAMGRALWNTMGCSIWKAMGCCVAYFEDTAIEGSFNPRSLPQGPSVVLQQTAVTRVERMKIRFNECSD